MRRAELRMTVGSVAELQELFEREWRHRRAFVSGRFDLADREVCALVLVHPSGAEFKIPAEAVYLKREEPGAGAGLDLVGLDATMLAKLGDFVREPPSAPAEPFASAASSESGSLAATEDLPMPLVEDEDPEASDTQSGAPAGRAFDPNALHGHRATRNVHERVRQLSLREREAMGRSGTLAERVALERAFGGSVWEALLQNPQLTAPEVARIAKNGSLSVPLVGVIVSNASWLASGEVRRALLGNPRVSGQNLERVLRAFPRGELKQVAQMSAYRSEVRSAAQRLAGK